MAYARASDGSLGGGAIYATGGKGTGAGLGDQGALAFDAASNRFYAVNAGDSSVSMLSLGGDGKLALLDHVASGGVNPISVTAHGDVVYVVNGGDMPATGTPHAANIFGLRVMGDKLVPLNVTQPLSTAQPAPAQIQFVPDGSLLIVTEKNTNMIATFPVSAAGMAGPGKFQMSAGMTPFGFELAGDVLVVSEAGGAADGASTGSSYTWAADGTLTAKTAHVATTRTAACLTATSDGYLYTLSGKDATINVFKIGADGTLTKGADFPLQLATAVGIVAR